MTDNCVGCVRKLTCQPLDLVFLLRLLFGKQIQLCLESFIFLLQLIDGSVKRRNIRISRKNTGLMKLLTAGKRTASIDYLTVERHYLQVISPRAGNPVGAVYVLCYCSPSEQIPDDSGKFFIALYQSVGAPHKAAVGYSVGLYRVGTDSGKRKEGCTAGAGALEKINSRLGAFLVLADYMLHTVSQRSFYRRNILFFGFDKL